MANFQRYIVENGIYHIYNRGAGKRHVFFNDYLKILFLQSLTATVLKYNFKVYAFCIMGNHYHLLLKTPEANICNGMKFLNSRFALAFNQFRQKDGPVFKGRYGATFVQNTNLLAQMTKYIHLNPVKAGLVKNPEQYSWSSCLDFLTLDSRFFWLDLKSIQRELKLDLTYYSKFLTTGSLSKITDFYSKNRVRQILK